MAARPDLFETWDQQRGAIKLARQAFANMKILVEGLVPLGVSPADAMTRIAAAQAPATA